MGSVISSRCDVAVADVSVWRARVYILFSAADENTDKVTAENTAEAAPKTRARKYARFARTSLPTRPMPAKHKCPTAHPRIRRLPRPQNIYIYTSPNSILGGSGGRGLRAPAWGFASASGENAISNRRRREHRELERTAACKAPDRGTPRDRPRPIAGDPAIWVPRAGPTRPDRGTPRDSGRPIAGGPARSGRIGSGSRDSSRRPGADRGEPRSLAAPGRANGSRSQGSSRLAGADRKESGDLPVSRAVAEAVSRTRYIHVLILSWTVTVGGGCVRLRRFSQVPRARARFPAGVAEGIGSWSTRPRAKLQIAGHFEVARGRSRGVRRFERPGPGRPLQIAGLLEIARRRSRGVLQSERPGPGRVPRNAGPRGTGPCRLRGAPQSERAGPGRPRRTAGRLEIGHGGACKSTWQSSPSDLFKECD